MTTLRADLAWLTDPEFIGNDHVYVHFRDSKLRIKQILSLNDNLVTAVGVTGDGHSQRVIFNLDQVEAIISFQRKKESEASKKEGEESKKSNHEDCPLCKLVGKIKS